ncbi:PAS domain S-box protein [Janthinobacterium sp. RB2R34]|uniref:hybrid sensor histidine kinase/response regulator n=1 Tax=Janthinobacterium sp. RB2R34 TaxID=3424193 RepID=UPI003F29DE5E
MTAAPAATTSIFLQGAGEVGDIILAKDWTTSTVGPIAGWTPIMRNLVAMIVRSPIPMVTMWGEQGTLIYNEAYATFAGSRHPEIMGMTATDAFPDLADFNRSVIAQVLGGAPLSFRDQELTWMRDGRFQRYWLNLDYSPIYDDHDLAVGIICVVVDTTDKVNAERHLKHEHARMAQMFDQAPGFMALLQGPQHRFTQANRAYAELVGHRELIGLTMAEALPEADEQGFVGLLDALYASGEPFTGMAMPFSVAATASMAARETYIDFVYQPVRDEDGVISGIFVQGSDVTQRVLAEKAWRQGESRFRVWAQAMPNHIWSADAAGNLDWFSDQIFAYSGASPGELNADNWPGLVHADDIVGAVTLWRAAVDSGQTFETEYRVRRHDGQYRWHLIRALPIRDEDGMVISWIGTNTDIEEQKRTTLKLEHLNATLAEQVSMRTAERDRMWRLSNEIMLVSDFNATLVSVNPAFVAVLGWPKAEVLGSSFMELVHPDDRASTLEQVSLLASGERTIQFENRYRRKEGGYSLLSWSAVPDAQYIHAVARDVTAERAAALAMKQTEKALEQSQKMDAIGKLTGGVAHDFNNLLQVISGNLQMLATVPFAHPRAAQWVENAIGGVNRGARLASSLLAFGRRQALEPRVLKIGKLMTGMEDMLRHALGEPIDIETIVSGGLWNTLVDPTQVETALLNLAINARDAMDGPGRLTIEVGNAYLDEPYCRSHAEVSPGQYVTLAVTDTGCGMTPDVLAHAFDPFFSTKPEGKGTGLGLSMVYGFVKQSGGHIKIYSEVGQGTTVKIYLPRSMDEEARQETMVIDEAAGGEETILVAEDDEQVRTIVVEMLGGLGYRVLKANDASAALSILESGIAVDLLFTDVVMPGPLRSAELARRAVELLPNLAVLFTSGYTENSIVHGGRLDPGVELLGKPYSRDSLARKIRQVLGNRKPVAPPDPTPAATAIPATRKILLVEDEDAVRAITFDMLQLLGHEVQAAVDGHEALAALEAAPFDILITDLGLPGLSGAAVAEAARRLQPSIHIVIASGQAKIDGTHANAALLKPYDLAALQAVLA